MATKQQTFWAQGGPAADIGARVKVENPPLAPPPPPRQNMQPARPRSRRAGAGRAVRPTERIRLAEDPHQQQTFDDFADLYALFVTTERIEKLWRRDAITDAEYEEQCYRLIQKFEALRSATRDTIKDIDAFYAEYNINAASGKHRLVYAKVPGTIEVRRPDNEAQGRHNIHCVQNFIGLLDNIELNQRTPEDLLNLCSSLLRSLGQVHGLAQDFPFREKLNAWIAKLNAMQPTEELSEDDSARFKMDVSAGYNEYLHEKS
eukprot:IDg8706t1